VWHGEAAKQRWRDEMAKRLIACAITLQSEHTGDLSTSYPPASAPGQYPRRRTGNLQSSVSYEPTSVAEVAKRLEVRVGYQRRANYIVWLIGSGRLALHATLNRIRSQLQAMLGPGGKVGG
jgi:hypothetical protein